MVVILLSAIHADNPPPGNVLNLARRSRLSSHPIPIEQSLRHYIRSIELVLTLPAILRPFFQTLLFLSMVIVRYRVLHIFHCER